MGTPVYSFFGLSTSMTISLNTLATATGRQSTLIENSALNEGAMMVRVFYSIKTGTGPTANSTVVFYLIQGDNVASGGANIRTDGAGATDAAFTPVTASIMNVVQVSGTTGVVYTGSFLIRNPGPEWGIGVVNNTGVSLDSSAGGSLRYVTESVST